MKFIFLDCDGVINTESTWRIPYMIKPNLIIILSDIVKKTNAKIILTSTWKTGFDKDIEKCTPQVKALRIKLQDNGADIYDVCPTLKGRSRDKEIERYLYFNPAENYVIIDDDVTLFEKEKNLYLVDSKTGITVEDAKEIVKRLKKAQP